MSTRRIWNPLLYTAAVALPAIFALYLALSAGELSRNDYWSIIPRIYSEHGFSSDLSNWFARQNEHILLFPSIIYAFNIMITRGSNIGLTLVAWFFALLQTILMIRLIPREVSALSVRLIIVFVISAFSFTPAAADNWMMGFSGVHWIGANLLSVVAIACLARFYETEKIYWIAGSVAAAVAGTLSYSSPLAVWPTLAMAPFLVRSKYKLGILYGLLTVVALTAYFATYETPGGHPTPTIQSLVRLVPFVVVYLGGLFTANVLIASILGFSGLLVSGIAVIYILATHPLPIRLAFLPWFLIQVYVLGNALMTTVARAGFGIENIFPSRYATLPALFWASLLTVVIVILLGKPAQLFWPKFAGVAALVIVLILAMYPLGLARAKAIFGIHATQPVAVLSASMGIPDEMIIKFAITPVSAAFLDLAPALKANQLVPFHQPVGGAGCKSVDQRLPYEKVGDPPPDLSGSFDFLDQFTDQGARAIGWINRPDKSVACIVLVNEDTIVKGFGIPGVPRPDIAAEVGAQAEDIGWAGYAVTTSADEMLTAYVLFDGDETWVQLPNSHSLAQSGLVNIEVYTHMIRYSPAQVTGTEAFNRLLEFGGFQATDVQNP